MTMATNHKLSKTTFMYGCQCPKRLYLHKFRDDLRNPEDEFQQSVFNAGIFVGDLARKLFDGGVDATPPDSFSYQKAIEQTQKFIEAGETIIYEAAFQFEGVMCALDILVKRGEQWYGYEVKSGLSVKEQHVKDAALQYYIITNSGLPMADISITHLNKDYVRQGEIDVAQLFLHESILKGVLAEQDFVANKIKELKGVLELSDAPLIDIGRHCYDPYACDFTEHCWAHIPSKNSVFELRKGAGFKLYAEGFKHLDEIPADYELPTVPALQLEFYRSGGERLEAEPIKEYISTFPYPMFFLDFETFMPGIPEFEGTRPYQQLPFQFSLHVKRSPEAELEHYEFLGDGINDPREELKDQLIKLLEDSGSIVCYQVAFEKTRMRELAEAFPDSKQALTSIQERMVDLMYPFQKRWYYHQAFNGGYSIKVVLPTLVPELSYTSLNIREGGTASLTYSQLRYQEPEVIAQQRSDLLAYCKLDTLAMVRILEKLNSMVESALKAGGALNEK